MKFSANRFWLEAKQDNDPAIAYISLEISAHIYNARVQNWSVLLPL